MTFDERGRIWITESLEYPRREPGPGRDRIKVLEDTDGDGRIDKFTIFAEGLNIPSGIAVGHGGVWVANAPDILFLQDTDGDGRADKQEVVVTGFGRDDTHELPNSLTWGPDGWLYGLNGVFNPSARRAARQELRLHLRAVSHSSPHARVSTLLRRDEQPLGRRVRRRGQRVRQRLRDRPPLAPGRDRLLPPPGRTVSAVHLEDRARSSSTSTRRPPTAAFTTSTATPIPSEYPRAALHGQHPRQLHQRRRARARRLDLLRQAARPTFSRANDAWFMPVVQKTGPDGCLYVLDWYDRYHCYQDANRDPEGIDRLKGRLYRVRYDDTPRAPKFDLAKETDGQAHRAPAQPERLLSRHRPAPSRRAQRFGCPVPSSKRLVARRSRAAESPDARPVDARRQPASSRPSFMRALLAPRRPRAPRLGRARAGNFGQVERSLRDKVVSLASDPSPDVRLQVAIAADKLDGRRPAAAVARRPRHQRATTS